MITNKKLIEKKYQNLDLDAVVTDLKKGENVGSKVKNGAILKPNNSSQMDVNKTA